MQWVRFVIALAVSALASPVAAQIATSGPILPSERNITEPSRSVPASEYRDAYCATWTDGCSVCRRPLAGSEPTCELVRGTQAACERQPVECRALLKTADRVCLIYTDNCNTCSGGACTLMGCGTRLPDGTLKVKESNFQCTGPRRTRYDDPQLLKLDLRGHWRLVDPQGRACEVVISSDVSLSPGCVALGRPVTQLKTAKAVGSILELGRSNGEPLLSFETSNLEALTGTERSSGYRLIRMEALPLEFHNWEGLWMLRRGAAVCDIHLSMRRRRLDDDVEIKVPHEVSLESSCLSPTDETSIEIVEHRAERIPQQTHRRDIFVRSYSVLIPRWTTWQVAGHDITFRDDVGQTTTFELSLEGVWETLLSRPDGAPLRMRLQRARR